MILYYSAISIYQENSSWTINTSKSIHLDTQVSFLNFCNYIFELISEKIFLLTHIDKSEFHENILDEIAYHSELEIYSSDINETNNIKIISFEYDSNYVQIKIFPTNKITIEARLPRTGVVVQIRT